MEKEEWKRGVGTKRERKLGRKIDGCGGKPDGEWTRERDIVRVKQRKNSVKRIKRLCVERKKTLMKRKNAGGGGTSRERLSKEDETLRYRGREGK